MILQITLNKHWLQLDKYYFYITDSKWHYQNEIQIFTGMHMKYENYHSWIS